MSDKKECDCLNKVEAAAKKTIQKNGDKHFNGYQIESSEWEHRTWYPNMRLFSYIFYKTTRLKPNGARSKPINEKIAIHYSFCPFCGVELKNK